MRGSDHHRVDRPTRGGIGAQRLQRVENAGCHILRGGTFDSENHLVAIQQHGVGISAAHVNSNASHQLHSSASALVENGTEIQVVTKGAGADEFEAAWAGEDGGSGQRHHGDALAVAHRLCADRMA